MPVLAGRRRLRHQAVQSNELRVRISAHLAGADPSPSPRRLSWRRHGRDAQDHRSLGGACGGPGGVRARATDFTIGVEEEFAILDPQTLDMVPGFERFAAAHPERAAGRVGGRRADPLRGRDPHGPLRDVRRGGRGDGPSGGSSCSAVADDLGVRLAAAGSHPFARLAGSGGDRHAALSPGRVDAPLRGLAQQHVRDPRPHRHPRRRPGDRRQLAPCARCSPSCSRSRPARPGARIATPICTRLARRSSRACFPAAGSPTISPTGPSTRSTSAS